MTIEAQIGEAQLSQDSNIDILLKNFDPATVRLTGLLKFEGVGERDVYNITAPFVVDECQYIAGRVEPRDDEFASETIFFIQDNEVWVPCPETPILPMQDPFVCHIGNEIIVGGVEAWPTGNGKATWRTIFWRGNNLNDLEYWKAGPYGMKGIRLVQLDDKIGLFTRPQGEIGGLGTIGFTMINSLDEFDDYAIANAKLLDTLFSPGEWGGVNQALALPDGKIGVLGHVARFEMDNSRSYYGMKFRLDPITMEISDYKLVASRQQFPPAEPKRPDVANVYYIGGVVSTDTVDVTYAGGSDSCAPFGYHERLFPIN